jgi:hypothetical protein
VPWRQMHEGACASGRAKPGKRKSTGAIAWGQSLGGVSAPRRSGSRRAPLAKGHTPSLASAKHCESWAVPDRRCSGPMRPSCRCPRGACPVRSVSSRGGASRARPGRWSLAGRPPRPSVWMGGRGSASARNSRSRRGGGCGATLMPGTSAGRRGCLPHSAWRPSATGRRALLAALPNGGRRGAGACDVVAAAAGSSLGPRGAPRVGCHALWVMGGVGRVAPPPGSPAAASASLGRSPPSWRPSRPLGAPRPWRRLSGCARNTT